MRSRSVAQLPCFAQARSADGTRARNADATGARNSRHNTGFEDGLFGLPAGHLNPGEGVVAAAVREVRRTRLMRLRARSQSLRATCLSLYVYNRCIPVSYTHLTLPTKA